MAVIAHLQRPPFASDAGIIASDAGIIASDANGRGSAHRHLPITTAPCCALIRKASLFSSITYSAGLSSDAIQHTCTTTSKQDIPIHCLSLYAARPGLARGAFAAEAALAAARGVPAQVWSPLREALVEVMSAAGLVRRVGT